MDIELVRRIHGRFRPGPVGYSQLLEASRAKFTGGADAQNIETNSHLYLSTCNFSGSKSAEFAHNSFSRSSLLVNEIFDRYRRNGMLDRHARGPAWKIEVQAGVGGIDFLVLAKPNKFQFGDQAI